MQEYKKGDEAWFIPGFRGSALFAVRVKVVEVDDHWRRKNPAGILFYWIDEPVGRSLASDDLYRTEEAARRELLARHSDWTNYRRESDESGPGDLERYRQKQMELIAGTWRNGGFEEYAPKRPGVDWFNIEMLRRNLL